MNIDLLNQEDVRNAVRLSTHVGWNQIEADWDRLLALNPRSCFGLREGEELVATAVLASYGKALAWAGMVIVAEKCRGRGFARGLLEEVLRFAETEGIATLGLDATDLGRPVYERLGFVAARPIDRWSGVLRTEGSTDRTPEEDWERILFMDREASNLDRSLLLRRLADEPRAILMSNEGGYALLRPGREFWHLGPAVAATDADFENLLEQAASHLDGRPVLMDVVFLSGSAEALSRRGLTVQRRLMRMIRPGGASALMDPRLRLAAGLEWG